MDLKLLEDHKIVNCDKEGRQQKENKSRLH